ncbi:MAG: PEP-CTERM sorting domain-containing protein [Acidobacteriota bacterium]|jgi:hypothetical protein|nr:PEP-CTERM sorting domain-containing protein [Acidobacteriota bacterium]
MQRSEPKMIAWRCAGIGCVACLLLGFATAPAAAAPTVAYDVSLVDADAGVWRYEYQLSGFDFDAGAGFKVEFDYELCTELSLFGDAPGWDVLLLQPDSNLPDHGYYDALFMEGDYLGPFAVDFTWLGEDAPGAQLVEFYRLADDGGVEGGDGGYTTPHAGAPAAVPEPASGLLFATGAVAAFCALRRKLGRAPRGESQCGGGR